MIKRPNQIVVGLLGFILFSTSGAFAQSSEPSVSALSETPKPIRRTHAKTHSAGSGAPTMTESQPTTIQEIKKYAEIQQTPENERRVERLDGEAQQLFNGGRYNDALLRWQEAYGMSIEMKYSKGQGRALVGMCKVYLTQGKWVRAKSLGENAVEILSAINDPADLGKARIALAQAYFGLDNTEWGIKQLDLAMKHLTAEEKTDPEEAANLMRLSGGILLQARKVIDAIKFFQQAARYWEEGNDLPNALAMHSKLSSLMIEIGFYVAAKEEADKAVVVAKRAKDSRAMLSALSAVANAEYILGEFMNAKQTYQQAYDLAGKLGDKQLNKEAKSNLLVGYAFSLIATGDSAKAEKILNSITPYFEHEAKYYQSAECLNALGVLMANKGEVYKAVPYFEKALEAQTMIKPPQPKMQVMTVQNIAAVEYRTGKYRESLAHLRILVPIFEKSKETEYQLPKLRSLVSLAEVSYKLSESKNAREYANRALTLGRKYSDDASLWRVYTLLAQLDLSEKETDKAKERLENALSHFRSPQAGYFPQAENLDFNSSRRALGQQLVALVASQGMTEKALLAAEQIKEEEIIENWIHKGVPVKAEDKDLYNDLINQRAHLHSAENSTTPDKLEKEWKSWLSRYAELAQKNKALARLVAPYPTTIEEIIDGVRQKKVTLAEYLVGEKSSVAFTIDPIGRISATVLPVGEDKLVSQVKSLISSADTSGCTEDNQQRGALQALYRELLPPAVMEFLPKSADKQIVIVPDSILYNLPFAALVDEQGKYFVEGHLLYLSPSVRTLLDSAPSQSGQLSVVVAIKDDPGEQSESSQILTAVEPDPVVTLSTQNTDIEELQHAAQGKVVLHMAAPIPFAENPVDAKLPFAQGSATTGNTAGTLFQLSLPSDLVFLSNTSISGSDHGGQTVQILSRGLRYAGAKNVVLSLWNQPSDTRTLEIANFYKNKKRGLNDAQSLRQAQLLALSNDRNPRVWAAFQLLGGAM